MSSSLDQRSSKGNDQRVMQGEEDVDYGFGVPGVYPSDGGLAQSSPDPYALYAPPGSTAGGAYTQGGHYMPFPSGGVIHSTDASGGVWSTDPGAAGPSLSGGYSAYSGGEYLAYNGGGGAAAQQGQYGGGQYQGSYGSTTGGGYGVTVGQYGSSASHYAGEPYGPSGQFGTGMLYGGGGTYGGQFGSLPGGGGAGGGSQYDYSMTWFPANFSTAWGPSVVVPNSNSAAKARGAFSSSDYNGYYEQQGVAAGIESNGGTGDAFGEAGEVNGGEGGGGVEEAMKALTMSPVAAAVEQNGDEVGKARGTIVAGGNNGGQKGGPGGSLVTVPAGPPVTKSWANIASQPAKAPLAPAIVPRPGSQLPRGVLAVSAAARQDATAGFGERGPRGGGNPDNSMKSDNSFGGVRAGGQQGGVAAPPPVPGQFNPREFDLAAKTARFFVIKSFSEDDIHRSIKHSIWCSTEYGNKRLDAAWRERDGKGPVYLFFSVNGSGHFCGMAQMTSAVDYGSSANVWAQGDKWKGQFGVKWVYVKDVPNSQMRHIRLENNEGKPVTNSRDTQEVLGEQGKQVLRILHQYRHTTSIFDDFGHYEKQIAAENGPAGGAGGASSTATVNGAK